MVRKRQGSVADDLAGFMAFSGDDEHVAGAKLPDRGPDRLGAVADLARASRRSEDFGADRSRRLAARIVVGDDHDIGLLGRDRAHDRPLALVPVAAAAEYADEAARG